MTYLKYAGRTWPETRTSPDKPRRSFRSARISNRVDLPQPVGPKRKIDIYKEHKRLAYREWRSFLKWNSQWHWWESFSSVEIGNRERISFAIDSSRTTDRSSNWCSWRRCWSAAAATRRVVQLKAHWSLYSALSFSRSVTDQSNLFSPFIHFILQIRTSERNRGEGERSITLLCYQHADTNHIEALRVCSNQFQHCLCSWPARGTNQISRFDRSPNGCPCRLPGSFAITDVNEYEPALFPSTSSDHQYVVSVYGALDENKHEASAALRWADCYASSTHKSSCYFECFTLTPFSVDFLSSVLLFPICYFSSTWRYCDVGQWTLPHAFSGLSIFLMACVQVSQWMEFLNTDVNVNYVEFSITI